MNKLMVRMSDARGEISPAGGVRWRGSAFFGNVLCNAETAPQTMARLMSTDSGIAAWRQMLAQLNGFFAFVWQSEHCTVCAVDRLRSIPLYYGQRDGEVFVGDDADWVRRMIDATHMNSLTRDEFQLSGYVTGNETLYTGLYQLQAGEMLVIETKGGELSLRTDRYFRFLHDQPPVGDEAMLRKTMRETVTAAVQRLIDYADGRQIAIPLSGGYDSRLVATLLAAMKAENLLAFSYGAPGNKEAAFSQRVAQSLGIPWRFVEYGKEQVREAWTSEERKRYQLWASGWVSLPHIQDWVAVRTMKRQGILQDDCVFAPGHTCFRRNTGITAMDDDSCVSMDELAARIRRWHYSRSVGRHGPKISDAAWRKRIFQALEATSVATREECASLYEKWEWQERQAKFIGNSVRVYEFFGYDWWLPLWDARLMDFARTVPLTLRYGRRWYNDIVIELYADQTGINISDVMGNAEDIGMVGRAARALVSGLPESVRHGLKRLRDAAVPPRYSNSYVAMHLSEQELKRLRGEGYRNDGMFVRDFLNSYGQL